MIDGKEKPKIPSKFAIRAARYNEFHCALCGYFSKHVYVVNCYNDINNNNNNNNVFIYVYLKIIVIEQNKMEKSITFCNADKHTIKRSVRVLFMIS